MLEKAHHLELAEHALGTDQALEHVRQLLQCHPLAVAGIGDRPNHSKSSVADRSIGQVFIGGSAAGTCEIKDVFRPLLAKKVDSAKTSDKYARSTIE